MGGGTFLGVFEKEDVAVAVMTKHLNEGPTRHEFGVYTWDDGDGLGMSQVYEVILDEEVSFNI